MAANVGMLRRRGADTVLPVYAADDEKKGKQKSIMSNPFVLMGVAATIILFGIYVFLPRSNSNVKNVQSRKEDDSIKNANFATEDYLREKDSIISSRSLDESSRQSKMQDRRDMSSKRRTERDERRAIFEKKKVDANANNASPRVAKVPKVPFQPVEGLGNVVILSYRGHVGGSLISNMLSDSFSFNNLHSIFSRAYWTEGMNLPVTDASVGNYSHHELIMQNYIASKLHRSPKEPVKVTEVEVADAWSNGVSVDWLLDALHVHGGVTHIIKLVRNPVRVQMAVDFAQHFSREDDASEAKHLHDMDCNYQKHLFEVTGGQAIEIAMSMSKGFADTLHARLSSLKQLGLSYEGDLLSGPEQGLQKVQQFLGLRTTPAVAPEAVALPHSCPLSVMLHNYDMLQCELAGSPLEWVTADTETPGSRPLSETDFEDSVLSGKAFASSGWMQEARQRTVNAKCEAQQSEEQRKHADDELQPLNKVSGHCGHGGHTDSCWGHGKVSEFVCRKIFEASGCGVMTYKADSECYMHMADQADFWIGLCDAPGYHATIVSSALTSTEGEFANH